MAFIDAFLRVLSDRAPDVAQPFATAMASVRAAPKQGVVNSLYDDFREWCRCLPPADRRDISAILQSSVGLSLDYYDKKRIERLANIVQRGFLKSDAEWYLVEDRIQELCESDTHCDDTLTLDRLLRAYEEKKRQKKRPEKPKPPAAT